MQHYSLCIAIFFFKKNNSYKRIGGGPLSGPFEADEVPTPRTAGKDGEGDKKKKKKEKDFVLGDEKPMLG